MPTYMSMFTYTGDAWARMVRDPADRAEAARATIEEAGGWMTAFYWMFADYDGLVIYEMPTAAAAAAFSASVAASGRIATQHTHQLLPMAEAREALEMASAVGASYRPPGAPANWHSDYDALGD